MTTTEKITMYVLVAFIAACGIYVIYTTGVHNARKQVCEKVGGVYVNTYNAEPQCINATTIELK